MWSPNCTWFYSFSAGGCLVDLTHNFQVSFHENNERRNTYDLLYWSGKKQNYSELAYQIKLKPWRLEQFGIRGFYSSVDFGFVFWVMTPSSVVNGYTYVYFGKKQLSP
jgi:hypothetical protein